jgi:exonuclease SbcC
MRPQHLRIEGFTSYREAAEVDFTDLDLFAITGPTGAGKSSLIDAMTFALFGKAPRVGSEIKDCIAQGMDRMSVAFEFTVGEARYRVFRRTTRKGSAPQVQLEQVEEGEWRAIAGRVRDMNAQIESILGLDYEAFTRSVLLPQGQFHQFLSGKPEERRKVLTELLRLDIYERIRQCVGSMARETGGKAAAKQREVDEYYGDATTAELEAKQKELKEAQAVLAKLEKAHEGLAEGHEAATKMSDARTRLEAGQQQLEEASSELAQAEAILKDGEQELEQLAQQLQDVNKTIEANAYDADLLVRLNKALALARQVEELDERLQELREQVKERSAEIKELEAAVEAAAKTHTEAKDALGAAEARLLQARRDHQAADLRAGLKPGDPCPVCREPVGKLSTEKHAPVAEADKRVASAKKDEQAAARAATTADRAVDKAHTELAAAQKQEERDAKVHAERSLALKAELKGGEDGSVAGLEARAAGLEQAREELRELTNERDALDRDHRDKDKALQQARRSHAGLTGQVTTLNEGIAKTNKEISDQVKALGKLARSHAWEDVEGALDDGEDALSELKARVRACEKESADGQRRVAVLEERIATIEKNITKRAQLEEEILALRTEAGLAEELAKLLRADHFVAFVEDEALRILAEDGSRQLLELSGGRYTLQADGRDFYAVDRWNADERRHVRTLSGGETFLASLALAVALAERLPELAGSGGQATMESLFLDEGFGSLDEATRDVVADALEALRLTGRLVCIITHVRELAERLPAQVEVNKSEAGSQLSLVNG